VPELAAALAALPVKVTDQGETLRYGDLPGVDTVHLRGWAKTLRQADPDAIQYHASGRIHQYVANIDLEAALGQVTCPTLLLQADPAHGGIIADEDVPHILSLLTEGVHVKLEGAGHDLGLGTWRVAPLLRAVSSFLESL
jgi:pimeloyl-ACP methyl ester carboxylesterase